MKNLYHCTNCGIMLSRKTTMCIACECENTIELYGLMQDGGQPTTMPKLKLADLSWAEIKRVCEYDNHKQFEIGDSKKVELTNGETIEIIVVDHDRDGAKITLGMKDLLETEYGMNNTNTNNGGWAKSKMRNRWMPYFFNLLPQDLKEVITEVKKKNKKGGSTEDKLWLFSESEIFGDRASEDEGEQYEYYKNADNRVKQRNGENDWYWLRSPYSSSATNFCYVGSSGNASNDFASFSFGVCLGFCI